MTYNQSTTEQFIERARSIHGDKYDYSETVYISTNKKVAIRCKRHGIFVQHAGSHINSRLKAGCPYCAGKRLFRGENDLATVFPNIAPYYETDKNGNTAIRLRDGIFK